MASITTTLHLADHISAPLQSMVASIGTLLDGLYELDTSLSSGFGATNLSESVAVLGDIETATLSIGEAILQNTVAQESLNLSLHEGAVAVNAMRNSMESMAVAYENMEKMTSFAVEEQVQTAVSPTTNQEVMQGTVFDLPKLDMAVLEDLRSAETLFGEINFNSQMESLAEGLSLGVEKVEGVMAGERIMAVAESISGIEMNLEMEGFAPQMESMAEGLSLGVEKVEGVMAGERIMAVAEAISAIEMNLETVGFAPQMESMAEGLSLGVEKVEGVMAGERIMAVAEAISGIEMNLETVGFAPQMESMAEGLSLGVEKVEGVMADERIMAVAESVASAIASADSVAMSAMESGGIVLAVEHMVESVSTSMSHMAEKVQSTMEVVSEAFSGHFSLAVLPVISSLIGAFFLFGSAVEVTTEKLFLFYEMLAIGQNLFGMQAVALAGLVVSMNELAVANMSVSESLFSVLSPMVFMMTSVLALAFSVSYLTERTLYWGEITVSVVNILCEILASAVVFVSNLFLEMVNYIIVLFTVLWEFIGSFATFFGGVFHAPVQVVADLFYELLQYIVSVVSACARAIDGVFGSQLSGAISGFHGLVKQFSTGIALSGEYTASMEAPNLEAFLLEPFETSAVFANGFGDMSHATFDAYGQMNGMENTLDRNVGAEDFSYLRSLSSGDSKNQLSTTEISVNLGGVTNHVNQNTDLDGFISYLTEGVETAMAKSAEGVHY